MVTNKQTNKQTYKPITSCKLEASYQYRYGIVEFNIPLNTLLVIILGMIFPTNHLPVQMEIKISKYEWNTWNVEATVFNTDGVHSEFFRHELDGVLSRTDFTDLARLRQTW